MGQENDGLGDEKLKPGAETSRPFSMLYPGMGRVFFPPLVNSQGGEKKDGRIAPFATASLSGSRAVA
jgi:hypothetical protein